MKISVALRERINNLLANSVSILPEDGGGTGAKGNAIQRVLRGGVAELDNRDSADVEGWESKVTTKSGKNDLLTLFRLEPENSEQLPEVVSRMGKLSDKDTRSLFHTIRGRSRKFAVSYDKRFDHLELTAFANNGDVSPVPVLYWRANALVNAFSKLRRLVLVRGVELSAPQRFVASQVDLYDELVVTDLVDSVVQGRVAIEFQARETDAKTGLRNHGTTFRVPLGNLRGLYRDHETILRRGGK